MYWLQLLISLLYIYFVPCIFGTRIWLLIIYILFLTFQQAEEKNPGLLELATKFKYLKEASQ